MKEKLRLFRTIKYLQPRQVAYQLKYRIFQSLDRPPKIYPKAFEQQFYDGSSLIPSGKTFPIAPVTLIGEACFSFLNLTKDFVDISNVDWNFTSYGKLWVYNLNYFEFLRQPDLNPKIGQALIDDWLEKSTTHRDAWEPYPLSLRQVHWLCFYHEHGVPMPERVSQSLYNQYRSLWGKREYHLGGNHLLENAIALSLGAWFFKDEQRLLKALKLLHKQMVKQYLPLGVHYELSPTYHCVLLWRLLDFYALIYSVSTKQELSTDLLDFKPKLIESLTKQLSWLQVMTDEKGNYPHFNDSTSGIAPNTTKLFAYAEGLGLNQWRKNEPEHPFPFRKYQWGETELWINTASVGPNEQAGHAHADNLSFCLTVQGQPLIVDTGISTYEKNFRRLEERGTGAHNTVRLNGKDSSEIWGGFRCGRRAETVIINESENSLMVEHDGYQHLGISHRRRFCWEQQLTIQDEVKGAATAYLHFHPDLKPQHLRSQEIEVGDFFIEFSSCRLAELQPYKYAEGFNQLLLAWRLVIDFQNTLSITIRNK